MCSCGRISHVARHHGGAILLTQFIIMHHYLSVDIQFVLRIQICSIIYCISAIYYNNTYV